MTEPNGSSSTSRTGCRRSERGGRKTSPTQRCTSPAMRASTPPLTIRRSTPASRRDRHLASSWTRAGPCARGRSLKGEPRSCVRDGTLPLCRGRLLIPVAPVPDELESSPRRYSRRETGRIARARLVRSRRRRNSAVHPSPCVPESRSRTKGLAIASEERLHRAANAP